VSALAFSRNGCHLASGSPDCVAKIWDLQHEPTPKTIVNIKPTPWVVAFDKSLMNIVAFDYRCGVHWVSQEDKSKIKSIRSRYAEAVRFRTEPSLVISPSGSLVAAAARDGKLEVLDSRAGRTAALLADERGDFIHARFLENDNTLLGIVDCGLETPTWAANVWDTTTSRLLYPLPSRESIVTAVATHPNGKLFAIANRSTIEVYELPSGALVAQFGRHANDVVQLAFSPDGTHLASICYDQTATLWDWAREIEQHRLVGRYNATVGCMAFSPDGRTFVTGEHGGLVRFWNVESGQEMIHLPIEGHPGRLQFSADGNRLACWFSESASRGHSVRIWSIEQ
jgi:WD40 repeat protein